jgi:DNA topoisomerase VI subunit A
MLARLRREILPDIKAWKMNEEELVKHSKFTNGFTDTYRKRLVSLLETPELHDHISCIEFMLKSGVRLEQEAMLLQ